MTKADLLYQQIADAVGAGKETHLESVDFSNPNRPKTCLEVDFPIIPINRIAQIEGNAGKPIYQMSKWWARRRSSVFRAMLIAAAAKAPDDPLEASKTVWNAYYGNHQKNEAFKKLKVADIFMGGGTTIVEGARLGMQMYGNDLNPVAWLVVKNELAEVDIEEVKKLFDHIEAEVKPQIMPFYACDCPRGHKGRWYRGKELMGADFDPLVLSPEQRKAYRYEGPEIIYTFWAKHGPCSAPGCGHRTPLMSEPVIAIKTLSVKAWLDYSCPACGKTFDIEQQEARMAPGVPLFVADTEQPYAVMDAAGFFSCPHCGAQKQDDTAALKGQSSNLGKSKNKKIDLTLLIHPDWLKGAPGKDEQGREYGGSATDSAEASARWHQARAATLRLLEARGQLPEEVTCPETGVTFSTSKGTIPKRSTFTCQAPTCGREQDVLTAIKATQKTGPMAPYVIQGYCPECDKAGMPYNGRFFAPLKDVAAVNTAWREWEERKDEDLAEFWPRSELPYGFMTHHLNGGIPNHGFTHWWKMFNPKQLLIHSQLVKSIQSLTDNNIIDFVIGTFGQYIRNQSLFCFWDISRDCLVPMLSNSNYHQKSTIVENSVFSDLGRGNFESSKSATLFGIEWARSPWEVVSNIFLSESNTELTKLSGKSNKVLTNDKITDSYKLDSQSSTDLVTLSHSSYDLVITDPPFGGLLHYSELADFFYVWLRLCLKDKYPDLFGAEYTPKTLEAVANKARNPEDPDGFYRRILTECWREAHRILKPGGILAFTFHHSEDEPWVDVLESLFGAGFYLEATYPIRSDETKGEGEGEGEFGSKKIEYDIIHVCRKRTEDPARISWPRLRRRILEDVRNLKNLLEQHQQAGLPEADMQVIKRGKALEYFSRHYGQVFAEEGRDFTVKEALLGINQLLYDEQSGDTGIAPPANAEPLSRQFLRIFMNKAEVPRDQVQKFLRGTGMGPSDFTERGWCFEQKKVFYPASPLKLAQAWQNKAHSLGRDLDQALLLIGACFPDSGIALKKILDSQFKPHPALGELLDWLTQHGFDTPTRQAAAVARTLYLDWQGKHKAVVQQQQDLFG